ncbi:asparagine synthase-related protein [Longibacter salinarum]|nr:asparagine synthase-related protein [Longibacter salinarum]
MIPLFVHVRRQGAPLTASQLRKEAASLLEVVPGVLDVSLVSPFAGMSCVRPEGATERTWIADDGETACVADARFDHIDDLRAGFPVSPNAPAADIVQAAYREYDGDAPRYLPGDLAIVIWDERKEQLLAARDRIGTRPLFYQETSDGIVVSSELVAFRAFGGLDRVREDAVAEFLAGAPRLASATMYERVHRVPPGHMLVADGAGTRVERYDAFHSDACFRRKDPSDVRAAFLERFRSAVRVRCDAGGTPDELDDRPPAVLLSGGLDSSLIACCARDHAQTRDRGPVTALTSVYSREECSEIDFVEAVTETGGFDWMPVPADDLRPIDHLLQIVSRLREPLFAPHASASEDRFEAARDAGVRILLDGHGGDEVVSHGPVRMRELAVSGRWWQLAREARGMADPTIPHHAALLWGLAVYRGVGHRLTQNLPHRVRSRVQSLIGRMQAMASPERGSPTATWRDVLRPDLVDVCSGRVEQARRLDHRAASTSHEAHRRLVSGTDQPFFLESLTRLAASHGVELRFPFWDRDLVEFCLSLPGEWKLRDGWDRYILRDATAGVLPDAIRWRTEKTNFFPSFRDGLRAEIESARNLIEDESNPARPFVQIDTVRSLLNVACDPETHPGDLLLLWRVLVLFAWLKTLQDDLDSVASGSACFPRQGSHANPAIPTP